MYKIWIPVYNRKFTENQKTSLLHEVRRAEPDVVMLTFARMLRSEKMLREECELFTENKDYFEQNGIKVGAWIAPTVGYGAAFYGDNDAADVYTHIRGLRQGVDAPGAFCPLDGRFAEDFIHTLTSLAGTGVKEILFEDDFTLAGGKQMNELGCACDKHIKLFCERCGETLTREQIAEKVLTGGKNRYRDLWTALQRETLGGLAGKIEKAVHAVDPGIRMGLCVNGASFESEGDSIDQYERILAGNTRPFMRLTGAPYWKTMITLAPAIEAIRLQSHWCGEDMDLLSEGDTYPRPRHWVPAAYLEAYDMILRADGCTHGILKYMIDYNSTAEYETGYIDRHAANKEIYAEIEKRFAGKKTVGLNIAEYPLKFRERVFDEDNPADVLPVIGSMPTFSQRFLCDNSIPVSYGNEDCPYLAFGENARHLTEKELKNGVITDALGAKILMSRGIDVGITSMERMAVPSSEYYIPYDEYACISVHGGGKFYDMTIKDGAKVVDEFIMSTPGLGVCNAVDGAPRKPACFLYENADGYRFMVYSFIGETVHALHEWAFGLSRNYCRQKQICDGVKWLGKPLPATCNGNPDLYILCKKDENSMTVGLWNLFADSVLHPVITLDDTYDTVDFYRCGGTMQGDKVYHYNELAPYGFVCFTVRKTASEGIK